MNKFLILFLLLACKFANAQTDKLLVHVLSYEEYDVLNEIVPFEKIRTINAILKVNESLVFLVQKKTKEESTGEDNSTKIPPQYTSFYINDVKINGATITQMISKGDYNSYKVDYKISPTGNYSIESKLFGLIYYNSQTRVGFGLGNEISQVKTGGQYYLFSESSFISKANVWGMIMFLTIIIMLMFSKKFRNILKAKCVASVALESPDEIENLTKKINDFITQKDDLKNQEDIFVLESAGLRKQAILEIDPNKQSDLYSQADRLDTKVVELMKFKDNLVIQVSELKNHIDFLTKKYDVFYFSLGRSQIFAWTVIIVSLTIYIFFRIGEPPNFGAILVLMGISLATLGSGLAIDYYQINDENMNYKFPFPKKGESKSIEEIIKSQGFWRDIISDPNGPSIYRFQYVLFNLIFMVFFILYCVKNYNFYEFDSSILALLGISSGAYAILKIPERTK